MKIQHLVMKAIQASKANILQFSAMLAGVLLQLSVFGAGHASPASTARSVEARLAALETQPFKWDKPQLMHLSGLPVYVKSFSSPGLAVQAAQSLAANGDIFQRVLTAKNKIMLSGLAADWHWLAEIEPAAHGTKGYVSALYVDPGYLTPAKADTTTHYNWLPAYARKQFGQRISIQSKTVAQHIYSVALSPQALAAHLDRSLRVDGWASEPTVTDMEGASAWRRKQARLMLFPHASAVGTSLFVHLAE